MGDAIRHVMLAVHAAMPLRPGRRRHVAVGCFLRFESQNDAIDGGHGLAGQYGVGFVPVAAAYAAMRSGASRPVP